MNWYPLLGLLALCYSAAVVWITVKKPAKIWNMAKIQMFIKLLGGKGTEIFFYSFAFLAFLLGIWLFMSAPV